MVWIVDCNVVSCSAIFSGCGETVHFRTDTRIYLQTIKGWADAENVLRNIYKSPCSRSGKPAIFGFSVFWSIFSGYHLRIYIRLSPVNFTDIFNVNDRVDWGAACSKSEYSNYIRGWKSRRDGKLAGKSKNSCLELVCRYGRRKCTGGGIVLRCDSIRKIAGDLL